MGPDPPDMILESKLLLESFQQLAEFPQLSTPFQLHSSWRPATQNVTLRRGSESSRPRNSGARRQDGADVRWSVVVLKNNSGYPHRYSFVSERPTLEVDAGVTFLT